jgi:hypothetical protein
MGKLQVSGENSLFTILLFLHAIKNEKEILHQVREMQDQVYVSGEFNYQFPDDKMRDQALAAVITIFESDRARLSTKSENGIDLEGTVVYKGVQIEKGKVTLEKSWYAAYIRTATNEKGVVRSYISASDAIYGEEIKNKIVRVLKYEYLGDEIE